MQAISNAGIMSHRNSAAMKMLPGLVLAWTVSATPPVFGQGADDCNSAEAILGDGAFFFNNIGATTDGPSDCSDMEADVWFAWTADTTGTATISTCGRTTVNTVIAVYDLQSCPPASPVACNDNDITCSSQSSASWAVAGGATYVLRIGGSASGNTTGAGTIGISTAPLFGACCLPDGTCAEQGLDDCVANSGDFQGDGTSCTGTCLALPTGFTYQGRLNLNGSALTDTADFEFTLWDDPAAGNMIGSVIAIDNVAVQDGLFTVELNSVGEFGPNALNGGARWLEIAVRNPHDPSDLAAHTPLSPRQPVTPTPYATFAGVARTAENLAETVFVDDFGRVGIGRTPAIHKLEVEGNASKTTSGSWLANSDGRIKTNIAVVDAALDTLDKVRLVSFRYTDDYHAKHRSIEDRRYVNVIAQEFAKVFPDYVKGSGERLPDGSEILQVDAWPLTIYSAAAVQELHAKVKEKDAVIETLREKNTELEARLARIEAIMATFHDPKQEATR